MIPQINLIVLAINIILCICPTIVFTIFAIIKRRSLFKPFFVGFITFFISQVILRVPINSLIFGFFPEENVQWSYIIFIVLTAIFLEEGGRFLGLKFFLKKHTKRSDGIAFGIGFASGYNILFSLISHISQFLLAINADNITTISQEINNETIKSIDILSTTSWTDLLLPGLHNIAFVSIEIGLTIILLHGILNGIKNSIIAITLTSFVHILMEGFGLFLTEILKINAYIVELYIICISIISLIFIVASKRLKSFK